MQLCINDFIYQGQYSDLNMAKEVLLSHAKNISKSVNIRAGYPVKRTSTLKNRLLTENEAIYDLLILLNRSNDPKDKDIYKFILASFVKGPYISEFILEGCTYDEVSIDGTALCYCAACPETRALISPDLNEKEETLTIINGENEIRLKNYYSLEQIAEQTWIYQKNPKHDLPKDIIVKGNVWSKMSLNDEQAQKLLSKSVKIESRRCSFIKYEKQWYQFYNHEKNFYHGFPINNPGNDLDLNRVERFLQDHDCTSCGQLTI